MTEGGRQDLVEQIRGVLKAARPEKRAEAIADWMLSPAVYHQGGSGGRAWAVITNEDNIRIQDLRPSKLSAQEWRSELDRRCPKREGQPPRRVISVQFVPYEPYEKSSGEPRGAQAAGAVSAASCSAGTASSTSTAFQPERQTKGTAEKMETPRSAVRSKTHNPGRGRGRPRLDNRPGRLSPGGGNKNGATPRDR